MKLLCICLFVILICSFIVFYNIIKKYKIKLQKHIEKNKSIEEDNNLLLKNNEVLFSKKIALTSENEKLEYQNNELNKSIQDLSKAKETLLNTRKELTSKAFEEYCKTIEESYNKKEDEYNKSIELLKSSYDKCQSKLLNEINKTQEDLDQIKSTRAAAIQAQLREKEIEKQASFYCLQLSDSDIADIQKLNNIKKTLNKPRVLSMLIWQTWFQKPLKALAANVVGTSTITGIYKITNIITKECYIGQSVDIANRWNEHAKCGLGIDTPQANKLYTAMQEYGLQSFSWEVLEQCDRTLLDEKERYYINLYDSVNYGYNSNAGIKKGIK